MGGHQSNMKIVIPMTEKTLNDRETRRTEKRVLHKNNSTNVSSSIQRFSEHMLKRGRVVKFTYQGKQVVLNEHDVRTSFESFSTIYL
jgi:hypothetical protein